MLDGDVYWGNPSSDRQTLTFEDVDLDAPPSGPAVMWVGISAPAAAVPGHTTAAAVPGYTALRFTVGEQTSYSTPVRITPPPPPGGGVLSGPRYRLSPGGSSGEPLENGETPEPVHLEAGGPAGHPEATLHTPDPGSLPPLTVTAELPPDPGLQWGEPGRRPEDPHWLTVTTTPGGQTHRHAGTLTDRTLTFDNITIPDNARETVLRFDVSATQDAPPAYTSLLLTTTPTNPAGTSDTAVTPTTPILIQPPHPATA
ncbi:hypothetical protein IPZ58_16365 [Streptomyces roseoverticillatus]|uniref:hypothetical protein n=1 Tax=Streptomyces roseoverticillatus TaxID=66429 RepID=UPI001F2FD2C7|nr:hypothetical protein [Streptomyces roseoverticillatus]MCF3103146.1 hypothetical protein [Streptomyces roseoverticillatus]